VAKVKVKMESKIWKPYPSIEWLQGSRFGDVRTLDHYVTTKNGQKRLYKGHVLKQQRHKDGYMYVQFRVNGKKVHLSVHRIIAACFLPNPIGLEQVNHIDCNRTNNRLYNLEWCDGSYNQQYVEKHGKARGQRVIAINLKTLEASRFPSQHEAARQLGAYQTVIKDVIKGQRKQTHGYYFTNADSQAVESVRAKFGDSVARKVEQLMSENELQPA